MAINTYSKSKDGQKKLSANFKVIEFACKDGSDKILIDTELVNILQKIRTYFNKSVIINSAYRTSAYNKKVGGVSNSQHTLGTAADIVVRNIHPKDVAIYMESIMPNTCGIGLYEDFVHIDTRKTRSRWENFGTEKTVVSFQKTYLTTAESIEILIQKGIISQPHKWKNTIWKFNDVEWLIRKVGTYLNEN